MEATHYAFVDILKGIAILLIVYGHITPGAVPFVTDYVSTFHIPLFFFVSGLLYNDAKYKNDFRSFAKNRLKGLVLPFLYFSIIVALGYFFITDDYLLFVTHLLSSGWGGYALWFLPVLILVEFAYYSISLLGVRLLRLGIIAISAMVSYFSAQYIGLLPHNVLLVFCGLWFYGLGNNSRRFLSYSANPSQNRTIEIMLLGLILSLLYIPFSNTLPEWFINKIPSPIFYITPVAATIGLGGVSVLISKYSTFWSKFFAICGKQSFIILAFHQIICMIAQQYLPAKMSILIMIIFLIILVMTIPEYLPWMLGKSRSK